MNIRKSLESNKKGTGRKRMHSNIWLRAFMCVIAMMPAFSFCNATSFNLDPKKMLNNIIQPLLLPKDQASGRMYSASAGSIRYPYIAINNSIPVEAVYTLENHFSSIGYVPIGKNTNFKVDGKIIASCNFDMKHAQKFSNSGSRIYESIAECNLTDRENNFIIYTGRGITYGNDRNALRIKSSLLAFANLGRNSQPKSYSVSIDGFDNGVRTNRQTDYSEAVINAKKQAIERAGVRFTIEKKHGRNYKYENGQDKLEKYSKHDIESFASGILAPGYMIQDHGYMNDGNYRVTLKGHILQDPVTALRNHTDKFQQNGQSNYPNAATLLSNTQVQNIFEYQKTNLHFDLGHQFGTITIKITKTFQSIAKENCRTAIATYSWTSEDTNFSACRNAYARRWNLNY